MLRRPRHITLGRGGAWWKIRPSLEEFRVGYYRPLSLPRLFLVVCGEFDLETTVRVALRSDFLERVP